MLNLSHFTTEKLMNVARLRNVNDYENMSRQQLENIFTMLSVSIPTAIQISTPKPRPGPAIKFSLTPIPRPRRTPEPLHPADMDEFEKMECEKPGPYHKILGINGMTG